MAPRQLKAHLTPCDGINGSHSVAWPGVEQLDESRGAGADSGGGAVPVAPTTRLSESLRRRLRKLAAQWLQPFPRIEASDLRQGSEHVSGSDQSKPCPLVFVRSGLVFLSIRGRSPLFGREITRCVNELEGSFARRLVHILRFLLAALSRNKGLPDFTFKLCVDDSCHGVREGRALPFFTMVSCGTRTATIPVVQWNTAGGRDPDLSRWERTMAALQHSPGRQRSTWESRLPKAVWRGALNDAYVMNRDWSKQGTLTRLRLRAKTWKKMGRAGLLYQRCAHSDLLDVRLTSGFRLLGPDNAIANDSSFAECVDRIRDEPKLMPLQAQASRFRYVVHVEGNGGWSDRLKHLLLSGALVLKQAMGVAEFFEPLLEPWRHYVPVSSTLTNLSRAVRWARENDQTAAQIASDAAALVEEVLSPAALAFYMEELFVQYAHTHFHAGDSAEKLWKDNIHKNTTARFACEREPRRPGWPPSSVPGAHAIRCFLERLSDGAREASMRHIARRRGGAG